MRLCRHRNEEGGIRTITHLENGVLLRNICFADTEKGLVKSDLLLISPFLQPCLSAVKFVFSQNFPIGFCLLKTGFIFVFISAKNAFPKR